MSVRPMPAQVLPPIVHGDSRDLSRLLQSLVARPAAISWRGDIQPVPLHRSRVVFGRSRTYAHNEDVDAVYRGDLQMLWRTARLGRRPLLGDLAVVLTFAGKGRTRPDWTNLAKAVEDAGNPSRDGGWGGLWGDDAQIVVEAGRIAAWGKGVPPLVALDVWKLA